MKAYLVENGINKAEGTAQLGVKLLRPIRALQKLKGIRSSGFSLISLNNSHTKKRRLKRKSQNKLSIQAVSHRF